MVVLGLIDLCALALAWLVIVPWSAWNSASAGLALGAVILLQLVIGSAFSLYRNRYPIGSSTELRRQGVSGALVTICGLVVSVGMGIGPELSWLLLALLGAQILMIAGRQLLRMWIDNERRPRSGQPVVVIGAGEVGGALIGQMLHDPGSDNVPVAVLDDDPAKSKLVLDGVPVRGTVSDVREVVDDLGAVGVVVAVAQAPADMFDTLVTRLDLSRTWIRTMPSLADVIESDVDQTTLRDMDVADLIGRQLVDPETEPIHALVSGKTVLVTGAGGSIGSELCRIIAGQSPRRLIMLDRDESALHSLCMSLQGRALMDSPDLVLADIRDGAAVEAAFAECRPELVLHAAALKHLPMLESYPLEGWKTNVHGTLNVLRAARSAGVECFVNISTDKAANPSSELGRSKYFAERLTSHFAELTHQPYVNVRFGNVLGSRGSVLVSFADQIRHGGPVTVTHPDVTRYFMTIPEACLLVLQAAAEGEPGGTMVLDMGRPVRIVDVARRMMMLAGRTCPIAYTGLRDGEKLHEELFTPGEEAVRAASGRAWSVRIPGLDPLAIPSPEARLGEIEQAYAALVDPPETDEPDDDSPPDAERNPIVPEPEPEPEPARAGSLPHVAESSTVAVDTR
jgi:FlaA1/EpsC-like NDP-sugar epimerase